MAYLGSWRIDDLLTFPTNTHDFAVSGNPATNVTTVNGLANNVITAASIATDAIGSAELAADGAAKIADTVLRRTAANIEASSDGDAISFRSLYGAIAKLVNKIDYSASPGTVYKVDDSTTLGTQTFGTTTSTAHINSLDTV